MNKTEKTASVTLRAALWLLLLLLLFAVPLTAFCADGETEAVEIAPESAPSDEGADVNFSEVVSRFFDEYAGEIFSALSLAGTLLLAWLARRGLLPAMRGGLDGLAAGVDRLTECTRDAGERQSRLLSEFVSDAEPILRDLSAVRDLFASLSERTAELEEKTAEATTEREKLLALNRASVEMLKEVFTAARLPVTSKEELAAIYRRALDAVEGETEATP
ncbi:MAG: hypothetical protein J5958_01425 [Clostridia bacterium]|nr:hypothetical protein [Clostridia bacterium]